ncbi:hypothetical protein BO70DRAFT_46510 [Aspergillus heteromorphus CBS 117.55]|uniref:Uncharacterized protein n=1 Tax=Aspergillus heteromorphus CBS 117.55 TaxID=1448321 RepID=A0A317W3Q3_9EURO|nr:uncharacterized protein BO70DRAFT_46510 [Aspergillus heteromorphus CBS 117.55]PWY80625.1 hypothetical protein BO70DRAFT_46510 [Aspergillus heteromorphus CBS 117.55]
MNKGPGPSNVSSQSRSKLNAFRYNKEALSPDKSPQKTGVSTGHADKENQSSWLNGVVEKGKLELHNQCITTETTEPKLWRECPHTPGNRIPLSDLIGNAEDIFSRAPTQNYTPEDHVVWHHVPASSNADGTSRTPATHNKKRRHSSSPTSSPLAGPSKVRRKGSLDQQNYQTLMKTPQTDLASDLWNNYAGKTLANGKGELAQPRLANLLSSSPQTPVSVRTGRDSSGLRRSNSCIAEWPSSKAKRRRIDKEDSSTGRSIFTRTRSSVVDSGSYKSPNISSLVKRIEKTLQPTPGPDPGVSDSSPVPTRHHVRHDRPASPVNDGVQSRPLEQSSQTKEPRVIQAVSHDVKQLEESSSDYGDDDFDQDFIDLAEASIDPFVDDGSSNTHKADPSEECVDNVASKEVYLPISQVKDSNPSSMKSKPNANLPNSNEHGFDADEFDADEFDDDFDGISDNIDDLLVDCQATPTMKTARTIPKEQSTGEQLVSGSGFGSLSTARHGAYNETRRSPGLSGDEFDDDGLDIEAIEQSMVHSGVDGSDDVCHP